MPLGIRSLDAVHLFLIKQLLCFLLLSSYQLQLLPPFNKECNFRLNQVKKN